MTAEDEFVDQFRGRVLHTNEIDGLTLTIYDNGIQHVSIPRLTKVEMPTVHKIQELMSHIGGKYYNIFEFDSLADVGPEIREWASAETENKHTHTDAVVINSLAQKIITDSYLRFNRPVKPTKIFYSMDKAINWTFDQKQKNEAR